MSKKINKLSYAEYILIATTLFLFIFFAAYISSYKQLPSPVFGGDYYRDRGFVKNIVAGNPIWSDGFYADEIQYYPYAVFVIEAYFVKLTGANLDKTFLFFPLITLLLSSFVWYQLGNRLFRDKKWALLTAVSFLFLVYSISPKSSKVAVFLVIPSFLYFWLKYEQENIKKDAIFASIFLGLSSLIWGGVFVGMFGTFSLVLLFRYFQDSIKNKAFGINFISAIKKYYLIFIIAILISMIFFAPLILKYSLNEVNEVTEWGDTKIELLGPMWVLTHLQNMFFTFKNMFLFLVSIICLAGLFALIFAKRTKEMSFILLVFVANIIIIQHHLITRPVLGFSFLPQKLVYIPYLVPLFFVLGVKLISQFIKNEQGKKILFVSMFLLLLVAFFFNFLDFKAGQWQQVGFQDDTHVSALYNLADYIEANVEKDETILSNDESGFMLAVLSGRKVMLTRRTHANYYVDIDKRIAEAAVAMYGDDVELSKQILEKYNVIYLYLDPHFVQSPMRTRPEFADYLTEHHVNFTQVLDRYDIAVPPEKANLKELLLIPPQNFNPEFTEIWEKVYSVQVSDQIVGELYKLKSDST